MLPQFFGDAAQPDALIAIRAWTGGLFQALDGQDNIIRSGGLRHLDVPVAVITGDRDHYLSPALAAQLAGLFPNASHHVVVGASHWPQHDHPEVVAELIRGRPD